MLRLQGRPFLYEITLKKDNVDEYTGTSKDVCNYMNISTYLLKKIMGGNRKNRTGYEMRIVNTKTNKERIIF